MSALALQQQALLDALWSGDEPASGWAAFPRGVSAYRANAQALAERCLRATHPVVIALIGEANAAPLAHRLWRTQPPQRGDMAQWGAGLPALLATVDGLADLPWLADVARVEWALHEAAGAADVPTDLSGFARLAQEDPTRLTLRLASGTAVIASAWPVASLVAAHAGDAPDLAGVGARIERGERENALVWRPRWRPELRACSDAEAALLQALQQGAHLPDALDAAAARDAAFDLGPWLPQAVQSGLVCGVDDAPLATPGDPP
jgi:hypothetical protein